MAEGTFKLNDNLQPDVDFMMRYCGAESLSQIINIALAFLLWAAEKESKGREIIALGDGYTTARVYHIGRCPKNIKVGGEYV